MTDQTRAEQEDKILTFLRIANPIMMFGIILFALTYVMALPLVLAVTLACLAAAVSFAVISFVIHRRKARR